MANRKRGALWVTALIVVLISAALQILILIGLWLQFDSRLSCDRMIYWDEWFACMHGESHAHITFAEASIATWAAAGIVSALGRFLARFGSFLLPVGMAMTFVWFQIGYWLGWYRPGPRLALTSSDILNFTFGTCLLVLFWFGPSVSAWLLALHKRKNRARLQLSTVFK